MEKIYGYCRISRPSQNIERQERNIRSVYPNAIILKEAYTGRRVVGRKEFERLIKTVEEGDMVVFDSVSRMSRDAAEGIALYEQLYRAGIELVFLKEPHINTTTYRNAIKAAVPLTGTDVDCILAGVNEYMMILAKRQIELAFEQAAKEVNDLRQRTKEGIETARIHGKQIGTVHGAKLHVKKAGPAKEIIRKHSRTFGGQLSDREILTLAGISHNTMYKYKREIAEEMEGENTL